jgi:MIP family channel proteins
VGVNLARVKENVGKRYAAEFFGTLMFVFLSAGAGVAIASLSPSVGYVGIFAGAVATGIALALAISATMGVSGGHINPAVTVAMFSVGRIKLGEAAGYIISQVVGAVIGAALLWVLFPAAVGAAVQWGTPTASASIGSIQAIAIEAILTFFLVFAVFSTAVDERAPKIAGFGVGLVVMIDALVGGSLTGAAMNPARWAGPAIVSGFYANWYVYIIGPVIGAILAALLYTYLILEKR